MRRTLVRHNFIELEQIGSISGLRSRGFDPFSGSYVYRIKVTPVYDPDGVERKRAFVVSINIRLFGVDMRRLFE